MISFQLMFSKSKKVSKLHLRWPQQPRPRRFDDEGQDSASSADRPGMEVNPQAKVKQYIFKLIYLKA
jgi:hypothetical protein